VAAPQNNRFTVPLFNHKHGNKVPNAVSAQKTGNKTKLLYSTTSKITRVDAHRVDTRGRKQKSSSLQHDSDP
jgi:hypothetical protein